MPQLRLTPPADWPTLGWEVIDWIETYLCHGPGDVEGEPILLDGEVVAFIEDAYRLFPRDHPKAGRRVVFDATYSRPKGRAKSEVAGAIVCAEAKGPVRFGGWDAHGGPVGMPVPSPFIRCLATEEGQAGNTYDNVTVMFEHAKEVDGRLFADVDTGATRTLVGRSGEIRPSTSGAASKDGGKESFAVADEIHLYILPEHKQMLKTVRRNLRKRKAAQPWLLQTTTMYRPGENSAAEARHELARRLIAS